MRNILVIDDEEAIVDTLYKVLNRFGFTVSTAGSGSEGIVKFDKGTFDLVITDIRMPGVDGNGVVRHIRRSRRKATPVIGISGTPWLLEKRRFDAILPKPFTIKKLTDAVKDLTETVPGRA